MLYMTGGAPVFLLTGYYYPWALRLQLEWEILCRRPWPTRDVTAAIRTGLLEEFMQHPPLRLRPLSAAPELRLFDYSDQFRCDYAARHLAALLQGRYTHEGWWESVPRLEWDFPLLVAEEARESLTQQQEALTC